MEEVLIVLILALIVLIPVAGMTLRFALKPVVDSVLQLMEARARGQGDMLEQRVALLEQELALVRHLAEGRDFDRQLEGGRGGGPAG